MKIPEIKKKVKGWKLELVSACNWSKIFKFLRTVLICAFIGISFDRHRSLQCDR